TDDLGGEHAMAAGATEGADGHAYTEYWPMGGTDSAKVHYAFWVVGTSDTLNVNIVYKVEEKVANEVLSSTKASISAYPNPACEQVHFKMNLNNNSFALLVLRDLSGKMVKTMDVTGQNEVSLSLNGMKPGFYFYSVMQNNASVAVGKLVVR
ncbi:MAG: T9SS type A sorting domain-containing protein, partial [Bacteroidales bacterium]